MRILQALRIGMQQVQQTRRMILFAWLVNVTLSLTLAFPLLDLLDRSIRETQMEEQLLQQIDANWFQSFKSDHQDNALVQHFDYSILGYAPFLAHYESLLAGSLPKAIGNFLFDLLFKWKVGLEYATPLTLLALVYLMVSTFFASAFVGTYSKSYRVTFQEFLIEGARYFGKFFRIALVFLIVSLLLFEGPVDWWTSAIPAWTRTEPSELTPFVHYMARNGVVLFILGFLVLCFDYAKIRMVVDERFSALFATWAGVKFVLRHFASSAGLFLLLSLIGIVLMVIFSVLQGTLQVSGYWSILALFILLQIYVALRLWLKALFYASQTKLYQTLLQTDHRVEVPA